MWVTKSQVGLMRGAPCTSTFQNCVCTGLMVTPEQRADLANKNQKCKEKQDVQNGNLLPLGSDPLCYDNLLQSCSGYGRIHLCWASYDCLPPAAALYTVMVLLLPSRDLNSLWQQMWSGVSPDLSRAGCGCSCSGPVWLELLWVF